MNAEALLAPIREDAPCGDDLTFSSEFDHIAEMRREDDPTLDQGEWVTTLKVADWPGVAALCTQLLRDRAKDLRLAMWLTEALALTQGYSGLAQGLALCQQLSARYWEALHPQADDGDFEQRTGNIRWLLHKTVSLADARPITKGRQGAAYSLRDLHLAKQHAGHPASEGMAAEAPAGPTPDQFMRALKETPASHLTAQLQALQDCQDTLRLWQDQVDALLGDDGPSFVAAKEALANAAHELGRLMREAGVVPGLDVADLTPQAPLVAGGAGDMAEPAAQEAAVAGPIRTRAQALQQLREVAAFFRRTEPHSPVAYLADKAVKWGDMPLHEWLRHVVKDQGTMAHLEEMLGLGAPSGGDHMA